jgi:mono/diheme cytochrome c family protein
MQPMKIRIDGDDFFLMTRWARMALLLTLVTLGACLMPLLARGAEGINPKAFYQQHCVKCHGVDGSAVGEDGKKLRGQNFTDPDFQRNTTDEEMVHTILHGKFFGLAMPRFKNDLTSQEAEEIVKEVVRKAEKGKVIAPDVK